MDYCRAPYGARGLKLPRLRRLVRLQRSRAPYGARGLKWREPPGPGAPAGVAPRMGRVD